MRRWILPAVVLAVAALALPVEALAPESSLAGVRVGSKGIVVLRRYGNPTFVSPGLGSGILGGTTATTATTPANNPYAPTAAGLPQGIPPGFVPGAPGGPVPQAGPAGYGRPGTFNPYAGAGRPGYLPPANAGGDTSGDTSSSVTSGMAGDQGPDSTGLTTWSYRKLKGGPNVDFRLDEDGVVVEVVATGVRPSPLTRTSRGINLGDPYGKVLRAYGFPEESSEVGNILTVRYTKSTHIAFQFYKLKAVRIAVAKPKKATNATL